VGIFKEIKQILVELLDVDEEEITADTYLVRDLCAESIDFLELAVSLNNRFAIEINDDDLFLRNLRLYIQNMPDPQDHLAGLTDRFPFLSTKRIAEILADLDQGPVLKVKDLIAYIEWQTTSQKAA